MNEGTFRGREDVPWAEISKRLTWLLRHKCDAHVVWADPLLTDGSVSLGWTVRPRLVIIPTPTGYDNELAEALFHELCHWIVATPKERRSVNLLLAQNVGVKRELAACAVEFMLCRQTRIFMRDLGELGAEAQSRLKGATRARRRVAFQDAFHARMREAELVSQIKSALDRRDGPTMIERRLARRFGEGRAGK